MNVLGRRLGYRHRYEVLGLQVTVATAWWFFVWANIFLGPCPRCRLRRRSLFAHLMWLTTIRCSSWHRRRLWVRFWLWPSSRSSWGDQRRLLLLGLPLRSRLLRWSLFSLGFIDWRDSLSSRLTVGFAGWILPWYESEIGGDLASGRRADESLQAMAAG